MSCVLATVLRSSKEPLPPAEAHKGDLLWHPPWCIHSALTSRADVEQRISYRGTMRLDCFAIYNEMLRFTGLSPRTGHSLVYVGELFACLDRSVDPSDDLYGHALQQHTRRALPSTAS